MHDVARVICTEGARSIHRSAYTKLSDEEQANLRLWAARHNCRQVRRYYSKNVIHDRGEESEESSTSSNHPSPSCIEDHDEDDLPSAVDEAVKEIGSDGKPEGGETTSRSAVGQIWGFLGQLFLRK